MTSSPTSEPEEPPEPTDGLHDPRQEDRAVGIELQAIELTSQLEWADAQGRTDDARDLRRRLEGLYEELAELSVSSWDDGGPGDEVRIEGD